jgi:hypothetical protein
MVAVLTSCEIMKLNVQNAVEMFFLGVNYYTLRVGQHRIKTVTRNVLFLGLQCRIINFCQLPRCGVTELNECYFVISCQLASLFQ